MMSQDSCLRNFTRDFGVQTDLTLANEISAQSQSLIDRSSSHNELSTELEGAKLDIVLIESKIARGFLTS